MNLASLATKCRPIVVTLVMLLMFWGVISVMTMPRREDPEYTVRTCAVTTSWPGAPAQKVEELITKPLEEAIDRIDEVDIVRSTTQVGMSTIYVDTEDSGHRRYFPCRCLCLGLVQMTRTTPRRRMILHSSQIRLTEARTFISLLVFESQ